MVKNVSHYRLALWLTLALTLTELALFLYVVSISFERAVHGVRVLVPLAVLVGIWFKSNIARYLGAIWFLFTAGSVAWSLFSGGKTGSWRLAIWGLAVIALSLALCYILVFSKEFAKEFGKRSLDTRTHWQHPPRDRAGLNVLSFNANSRLIVRAPHKPEVEQPP